LFECKFDIGFLSGAVNAETAIDHLDNSKYPLPSQAALIILITETSMKLFRRHLLLGLAGAALAGLLGGCSTTGTTAAAKAGESQ
jgi:hypothetical protein